MEFFSDGHLEAVQLDTKPTLLDNLACTSHMRIVEITCADAIKLYSAG